MRSRVQERVADILETYAGEWFTSHRIEAEFVRHFGPVNPMSVQKAMRRLADDPESGIESRLVDLDATEGLRFEVCFPLDLRVERLNAIDSHELAELEGLEDLEWAG